MSATYDVTGHPLLSEKSKTLYQNDPQVFDAMVVAVERTLGLHNTSFTGDKAEDAKLAIVLQLNYENQIDGNASVYESVKRGEREWQYRADLEAILPRAKAIADRLLGDNEGSKAQSNAATTSVKTSYTW